jgi:glycosidase
MKTTARLLFLLTLLLPLTASAQTDEAAPWWQDRVFYEIFVRSFKDSDGDGIGDLQGLISELDYLNDGDPTTTDDLGITGIWLMPITEAVSYHGYDVVDYMRIDPDYGTNEDFEEFVAAAHERGIAVIIDLVLNHTSSEHPWFQAAVEPGSETSDWYIFSDEDPGWRAPWGSQAWHPLDDGRYVFGLFGGNLPDLNLNNPEVTDALLEVTRFWLEDMNIDGFRLDAVKHLIENDSIVVHTPETHAWLANFDAFVTEIKPDALTIGEIFGDPINVIQRYVDNDELDMTFAFPLADAMRQSATLGNNRNVRQSQREILRAFPNFDYAAFLTNHDQNRIMSQLVGNVGKAKVAASLLLTQPGLPFLYYGEEIGVSGAKPDENIRTPMQWTDDPTTAGFTTGTPWRAPQNDIETANVAGQLDDPDSMLSHYRALIHLRSSSSALSGGAFVPVDSSENALYAFIRQSDDQTLLVLINLSNDDISDYTLELDEEGILSTVASATTLFGDGDFALPTVTSEGFVDYVPLDVIPAFSTFIVELS